MNLLFDTNIILLVVRASNYKNVINFLNPHNHTIYISVVSEAEIKSIAMQNSWGVNRISKLNEFLDQVNVIDFECLANAAPMSGFICGTYSNSTWQHKTVVGIAGEDSRNVTYSDPNQLSKK